MINIEFKKGIWEKHFQYIFNKRFPFKPEFCQEEECIVNKRNPEKRDGFDYTTIVTKKKYKSGIRIKLGASFEEYGAPLITLIDEPEKGENGDLYYATCHEVVMWEKGINAFYLFETEQGIKWNQLLGDEFPLKPGQKYELCVEITEKYIRAGVGEKSVLLRVENLPREFYIGVTGCENINRIYSIQIEEM